jgi:hypothetical protein
MYPQSFEFIIQSTFLKVEEQVVLGGNVSYICLKNLHKKIFESEQAEVREQIMLHKEDVRDSCR